MSREAIEKRDMEVVEKFRAVVEAKERRRKSSRLRIAAGLAAMVFVGVIVFYKTDSPPDKTSPMHRSKSVALHRPSAEALSEQTMPIKQDASTAADAETAETEKTAETVLADGAVREGAAPEMAAGAGASAPATADDAVLRESAQTLDTLPVVAPRRDLTGKTDLRKKPAPVTPQGDIRIAKIVVCENVKNRQPVAWKNTFSIKQGAKPYVWMYVTSEKPPFELRHVYYLNGSRYCVVPLAVQYPRMRTWSTVTLDYLTQVGTWRVDVETTKGEVLSQTTFTVTP